MIATADLPDDIDALKAIIRAQQEQIAVQAGVIDRRETRIIQLERLVADCKRAMFGARSEQTCPAQFELALEDIEAAQEAMHAEDEADDRQTNGKPRPRKAHRGSLPKHLPRIEEVIEPESATCDRSHERHVIGEDVSERLDILPAQFRVIVMRRSKYACRSCESSIVQAPAPAHLIPGGMPTEATQAHVIVSKYADHLPLYRQVEIYSRQGIDLDRSTLAAWVGRAAFELKPVYDALLANLKSASSCSWMKPPRRCAIRGGARPRRDTSGPWLAVADRGTAMRHPALPSHLRRDDPGNMQREPGRVLMASCRLTAT